MTSLLRSLDLTKHYGRKEVVRGEYPLKQKAVR